MDRDALIARAQAKGRKRVELGDGDEVLIRALSVNEQRKYKDDLAEHLDEVLALVMIEPALTLEDAQAWLDTEGAGPDIVAVLDALKTISGAEQTAPKEAYKRV